VNFRLIFIQRIDLFFDSGKPVFDLVGGGGIFFRYDRRNKVAIGLADALFFFGRCAKRKRTGSKRGQGERIEKQEQTLLHPTALLFVCFLLIDELNRRFPDLIREFTERVTTIAGSIGHKKKTIVSGKETIVEYFCKDKIFIEKFITIIAKLNNIHTFAEKKMNI
jgi:hypothetical protein